MNIKKDLPIYVLSGAIVLSTLIYTTLNKSTDNGKPSSATTTSYITEEKYKSDMKIVLTEIVNLNGRMKSVEGCLSDTTRTLTQRNQVFTWCP
jgi:hypothetical protein